jgi:3-dehydrosphinganine reductase
VKAVRLIVFYQLATPMGCSNLILVPLGGVEVAQVVHAHLAEGKLRIKMLKNFTGKLAVITGGSSGIGFATAKSMVREGADVIILARRPEQLDEAVNYLRSATDQPNQRISSISVDVTDFESVQNAFSTLENNFGIPDFLVNSAGASRPGLFSEMDIDHFQNLMDINYFGTLYPIKSVLPGMIKRGSGHITLISSIAGFAGIYGYSAYGATKYAVVGLADVLRVELKQHNIQVSLVYPPDTNTPQLAGEEPYKPPLTKMMADSNTKVIEPEVVADLIVRAIKKQKYLAIPPGDTKLLYGLVSTLGLWRYPLMDMMVADAARKLDRKNRQAK